MHDQETWEKDLRSRMIENKSGAQVGKGGKFWEALVVSFFDRSG